MRHHRSLARSTKLASLGGPSGASRCTFTPRSRICALAALGAPTQARSPSVTVADYTSRIMGPGAAAVRAACPGCRVVAPGLASVGGAHEPWLRVILASHADDIDVVSGHIYSPFEEDAPGAGETSDSFTNRLDDHRVLTLSDGTVAFEGPLSFKELMDEAGVDKPFWLTETGVEADARDGEALERQRVYYRRVLEKMLSRPWWEATIFYEAFDNSELDWGLATPDAAAPEGFADKPVMDLLRTVTSEQPLFGGDGADCSDGLDNEGRRRDRAKVQQVHVRQGSSGVDISLAWDGRAPRSQLSCWT